MDFLKTYYYSAIKVIEGWTEFSDAANSIDWSEEVPERNKWIPIVLSQPRHLKEGAGDDFTCALLL